MKRSGMYLGMAAGLAALLAGCSTVPDGAYRPKSFVEKQALVRATKEVSLAAVRQNFLALRNTEVAWAGVIKDVQFRETERTVQVAFSVDHRRFDWQRHRDDNKPYHLSAQGEGPFTAGWTVRKPTQISYLEGLARPGYMLIVYGTPHSMRSASVHLAATAVRVIPVDEFRIGAPDPAVE